jgi:23S rRNA (adenine2503-C2)-methyltransferase
MTNLSLELRNKLTKAFDLSALKEVTKQVSSDKTEKFLFATSDNQHIETVVMPYHNRCTICVSTQVGCRYGCRFCASGADGFKRNLTQAEILDQIIHAKQSGHEVTHIVFMGMGEPLDNIDNLLNAIRLINAPDGLNIGARRITISTVGLPEGIMKLSELGLQVELSVSLHSAGNALRNRLMPINKRYPLETLIDTCREYVKKTNRQITFEYLLVAGLNDADKDAAALVKLLKDIKCQVNLIPFNAHSDVRCAEPMRPPTIDDIIRFQEQLYELGINVTVRESRGQDISAACGQLASKTAHIQRNQA